MIAIKTLVHSIHFTRKQLEIILSAMKLNNRTESDIGSERMDKSKNKAEQSLNFQRIYLFIYNLMLFISFLRVFIVVGTRSLNGTVDDNIVQDAASIVKMLTHIQLLEIIHPMFGLVPGGPLMPFVQVNSRILINHFLTESSIRLDSAPYVQSLFLIWSTIEIFRYSFYALQVLKTNIKAIAWCRYTLFLPLYPMGVICEVMIVISSIKHYDNTGQYSLSLPNAANISMSLAYILRFYLYFCSMPMIYNLMKHMWKQRRKHYEKFSQV